METSDWGYLVPQFPGQTHIFFWARFGTWSASGSGSA